MKKIININLSGRVIPIEDSAYERLQAYIESLRRYFSHEDGRDEIINDIESRIAEIMDEKIRKGASSVTDADVDGIMAAMGRPEDFDDEPAESHTTHQQTTSSSRSEQTYTETSKKKKNRLYRDSSDKILGGVCSGLANYMNVDPAIIRLLFAIITFGGFGTGLIIYILFWIILPEQDQEKYGGKRLFRNPEERVLGGVASGIAAYAGKEPYMVRLIFAAPLLLNIILSVLSWPFFHSGAVFPNLVFGSLTGTFILAYIILWIVLPEAKSPYQKMEMRGEKVDVNTIRQNVKEEMGQMKDRAKDFGAEVKDSAQRLGTQAKDFAEGRGKSWGKEVGDAGVRVGVGIGHIIGVLFKAFFLLIAGSIALLLLGLLMALIFGGVGIWPLKNYVLNGFWQNTFAWGTLLLFLFVPLIAFITWLVRRMMKVKSRGTSYLGWMFGGLWALGWICASLLAASLVNDFSRGDKIDNDVSVTQPLKGKMIVKVSGREVRYSGNFWWLDIDNEGWDINEDSLRMAHIKVRIEKSEDTNYHVSVARYSQGRDGNDARNRAGHIIYNASYSDSILDLASGLTVMKEDKFRFQRVIVNIKVPVGKKIRFDESVDMLHPYNIRMYEKRRWDRNRWDVDWDWDNYFDYQTNVDYTMKADGELYDPKKPIERKTDENGNDGYRYDDREQKKQDLKQREEELERQRKELEEEKKQLNDTTPAVKSVTQESMEDLKDDETSKIDNTTSGIGSPVFTLATMFN